MNSLKACTFQWFFSFFHFFLTHVAACLLQMGLDMCTLLYYYNVAYFSLVPFTMYSWYSSRSTSCVKTPYFQNKEI